VRAYIHARGEISVEKLCRKWKKKQDEQERSGERKRERVGIRLEYRKAEGDLPRAEIAAREIREAEEESKRRDSKGKVLSRGAMPERENSTLIARMHSTYRGAQPCKAAS
jgi:hypothetical protein